MVDGDDFLSDVIRNIAEARERLDRAEYAVIQYARAHGATWDELGRLLGISRQAAQSRWRRVQRRLR